MHKTPTAGGLACLTLACTLAAREGPPVTLVSGAGRDPLSAAPVRAPEIGCVSFVGGRDAGAQVAAAVTDLGKRHVLEQKGLDCWGVWEFSGWDRLGGQIRRTFDYAKQRRTAYLAPVTLLGPPTSSPLYHAEPFGYQHRGRDLGEEPSHPASRRRHGRRGTRRQYVRLSTVTESR